ncbi:DEAD/DEAH box helicase [Haloarcula terrestris]|nr:DEAD/DEAH box helicase [Haloarcula terrestris]
MLIPESVDRLLEILNNESLSSQRRVEIALSITPPEQLLRNTTYRDQLFTRLKKDEADQLVQKLGLNDDKNSFSTLKGSQFYKYSSRETSLFDYFDVPLPDRDDDGDLPGLTDVTPKYGLFDYQRTVFNRVMKEFQGGENRVFLHMPTGSGKTRITMSLVCSIIRASDPGLVLWLAEGQELLDQAADEFQTAWSHLGNQEVQISRFYGTHEWNEINQGLVVAGLRKLWNKEKKSATFLANFSSDVSLVVFDEAHQSVAETYQKMIDRLTLFNESCRLLGLSATPGRSYSDRSADRELAKLYDQNKIEIDVSGYSDPFNYLKSEGYLSKPEFHTLKINKQILSEDLREEVEGMSQGQDYSKAILRELSEDERRNLSIIRKILDLIKEGHNRIILFATTVDHARIISAALKGQDVDSAVITAETPNYIRERQIERFKSDNDGPRVLCNYNVLTTGFDAPQTSAAVIARPTTSLVLYSQMVGRAIRGPKVGGTEDADIWTVIDTDLPGFGDLTEAFWNWEDVW